MNKRIIANPAANTTANTMPPKAMES